MTNDMEWFNEFINGEISYAEFWDKRMRQSPDSSVVWNSLLKVMQQQLDRRPVLMVVPDVDAPLVQVSLGVDSTVFGYRDVRDAVLFRKAVLASVAAHFDTSQSGEKTFNPAEAVVLIEADPNRSVAFCRAMLGIFSGKYPQQKILLVSSGDDDKMRQTMGRTLQAAFAAGGRREKEEAAMIAPPPPVFESSTTRFAAPDWGGKLEARGSDHGVVQTVERLFTSGDLSTKSGQKESVLVLGGKAVFDELEDMVVNLRERGKVSMTTDKRGGGSGGGGGGGGKGGGSSTAQSDMPPVMKVVMVPGRENGRRAAEAMRKLYDGAGRGSEHHIIVTNLESRLLKGLHHVGTVVIGQNVAQMRAVRSIGGQAVAESCEPITQEDMRYLLQYAEHGLLSSSPSSPETVRVVFADGRTQSSPIASRPRPKLSEGVDSTAVLLAVFQCCPDRYGQELAFRAFCPSSSMDQQPEGIRRLTLLGLAEERVLDGGADGYATFVVTDLGVAVLNVLATRVHTHLGLNMAVFLARIMLYDAGAAGEPKGKGRQEEEGTNNNAQDWASATRPQKYMSLLATAILMTSGCRPLPTIGNVFLHQDTIKAVEDRGQNFVDYIVKSLPVANRGVYPAAINGSPWLLVGLIITKHWPRFANPAAMAAYAPRRKLLPILDDGAAARFSELATELVALIHLGNGGGPLQPLQPLQPDFFMPGLSDMGQEDIDTACRYLLSSFVDRLVQVSQSPNGTLRVFDPAIGQIDRVSLMDLADDPAMEQINWRARETASPQWYVSNGITWDKQNQLGSSMHSYDALLYMPLPIIQEWLAARGYHGPDAFLTDMRSVVRLGPS